MPLFRFSHSLAFSQTLVFFLFPFSAFSLLLFSVLVFSCLQFYLLSDSFYISAAFELSLSLTLYTSFYLLWFFNALWERLILLTCIKSFFDIFGPLQFLLVCPQWFCKKNSLKRLHVHQLSRISFQWEYRLLKIQDKMHSDSLYGPSCNEFVEVMFRAELVYYLVAAFVT